MSVFKFKFTPDQVLYPVKHIPRQVKHLFDVKIHIATSYRWMGKGVCQIRLPFLSVGSKRLTSNEALFWFFQAVAEAKSNRSGKSSSNTGNQNQEMQEAVFQAEQLGI